MRLSVRVVTLWLCLIMVVPNGQAAAQGPDAALDSLQLMIGSWEMVTFAPDGSGGWAPAEGVSPADWSFGPAPEGAAGGMDGVGQLVLAEGEAAAARIELRPGTNEAPVDLRLVLGSADQVQYVGSFIAGDQVVLLRADSARTVSTPEARGGRIPTGVRLMIEARDRFVIILLRTGGPGPAPSEYLLLEFRKHQTD